MKLPRTRIRRGRVEIIPMIDTILILLIFYMSFSTFKSREKDMAAKLPLLSKSQRVKPTDVTLDFSLHVKDRAHIVVNGGQTIDTDNLGTVMANYKDTAQAVTILISAEPGTDYQAVIGVLDICAQANLTKVAFRPIPDKVVVAP